jgi:hypothetical protein
LTDARGLAAGLVAELGASDPGLLRLGAIDLAPALEQHLFLRISAVPGSTTPEGRLAGLAPWATGILSTAEASASSAFGRRLPPSGDPAGRKGSAVILVLAAVHCRIWDPVADALAVRGYRPPTIVRAARFLDRERACDPSLDLRRFLGPGSVANIWRRAAERPLRMRRATRSWAALAGQQSAIELRNTAERALHRFTLQASRLEGLSERLAPSLLVTFAELSEWARLVAAVGRAVGVPTVGLPHAEAANPEALAGLDYDRLAVFGPRAAAVIRSAGYPDDRIIQTGPPHFDALAGREPSPQLTPRRVVFASQYTGGRMTAPVKADTLRVAIAAAAAVAPAELVIKRHPIERDGIIDEVLRVPMPPGLTLRIADAGPILDVLEGAWLLVTGWSNSIFEAGLLGVPSITVNLTGGDDPTTFGAEGLSIAARDPDSAIAAARELLDDDRRAAAVAIARSHLKEHLGPLDGHAALRVADLVVAMAGGALPRASATDDS